MKILTTKTFYKINTDNTVSFGSGTVIPQGFTEYTVGNEPIELVNQLFKEAIAIKISEIKQSFITATKSGFTCTNGITMDADLTSIQTLKSGYDLAVKLGATTMDITDYNNIDHLALPIANVDTMLTELGVNYNTIRVKKNTLKKQAESAKTQAELDLIVW